MLVSGNRHFRIYNLVWWYVVPLPVMHHRRGFWKYLEIKNGFFVYMTWNVSVFVLFLIFLHLITSLIFTRKRIYFKKKNLLNSNESNSPTAVMFYSSVVDFLYGFSLAYEVDLFHALSILLIIILQLVTARTRNFILGILSYTDHTGRV